MNRNDRDRMLEGIIENPGDDHARLVFADWLEENGDEKDQARAKLIRVQVAGKGSATRLLEEHGDAWAAPFTGRGVYEVRFQRGFVHHIECSTTAYIAKGGAWAGHTPLASLTLRDVAGKAHRLAACPGLGRIEELSIEDREVSDHDLAVLSPRLGRLVSLTVRGRGGWATRIGDEGISALADAPAFRSLACLDLVCSSLAAGPVAARALASAWAAASAMHYLDIACTSIGDEGAMALAGAAGLGDLESLRLGQCGVGSRGAAALIASPHLRRVSQLDLNGNRISGGVFDALAPADLSPDLRTLWLWRNPLDRIRAESVAEVLRRNPGLYLSMHECSFPVATRAALAALPRGVGIDQPTRKKKVVTG